PPTMPATSIPRSWAPTCRGRCASSPGKASGTTGCSPGGSTTWRQSRWNVTAVTFHRDCLHVVEPPGEQPVVPEAFPGEEAHLPRHVGAHDRGIEVAGMVG